MKLQTELMNQEVSESALQIKAAEQVFDEKSKLFDEIKVYLVLYFLFKIDIFFIRIGRSV